MYAVIPITIATATNTVLPMLQPRELDISGANMGNP
jgi:hypothetical protein